jgi:hypothetical protein
MPLIKPRSGRVPVVRHVCRLRVPNRDALVAYARFIGDSPDYVLNQLLEATLCKDKDFVAWRAGHTDDAPTEFGRAPLVDMPRPGGPTTEPETASHPLSPATSPTPLRESSSTRR